MTSPSTVQRVRPATVRSADGTTIAYQQIGSGPPVVVLPGAMNPGESWHAVADELAEQYTFLLVDRRFYPPSGDGPVPSSFEREIADVRAVIDAAGEQVHLLGHSYGALLALHAVRADPSGVSSLMLYEAPVTAPGPHVPAALATFRRHLADDDPFGAIGSFLASVVKLPPEQMQLLAAADPDDAPPSPDEIAAMAGSLLHDIESIATFDTPVDAWGSITVPTLIMAGAQSWDVVAESTQALHAVLPAAELVTWPDQSHFANMLAPALVADTIRGFLKHQR